MRRREFLSGLALVGGSTLAHGIISEKANEWVDTKRDSLIPRYVGNGCIHGYDFSSFIRHAANKDAYDCARRAESDPRYFSAVSPLGFYSDGMFNNGFGTTHLMHAIANEVCCKLPRAIVISSERLQADFTQCVRQGQIRKFRDFYTNLSALFIDDICFFSGKRVLQNEIVHIIKKLSKEGGLVSYTSPIPLSELELYSDSLTDVLRHGVSLPLGAPDRIARRAILQKKAEDWRLLVPKEVIALVSEEDVQNVRELEGMLRMIGAQANYHNLPVTIQLAESVLSTRYRI